MPGSVKNRFSLRKPVFSLILGVVGLTLVSASFLMPSAQALSVNSARDCDANAVIRCGALSTTELQQKFNNNPDVRAIFNHFGITRQHIRQLDSIAVAGRVTSDGRVIVNGRVVATGAMTAGRQNMSGSRPINAGGTQFFMRPPSVSFQSSSLPAFVVMGNGANNTNRNNNNNNQNDNFSTENRQFVFAIIASCGNPVRAQPKQPTPKPTPQPPAPVTPKQPEQPQPMPEQPSAAQTQQQQQQQQQQQEQSQSSANANANATSNATANVTVTQPPEKVEQPAPEQPVQQVTTPPPTVTPAPTETPTKEELPRTGMENVGGILGVAGAAALLGTIAHLLYTRRKMSP